MKLLLSPTKTQMIKETSPLDNLVFPHKTKVLFEKMQSLSKDELQRLFKLSDTLSNTVYEMYQTNSPTKAIDLYQGLVYKNLDSKSLNSQDLEEYLLILSAMYGIVRCNTVLTPYRLDYMSKLDIDLYTYWKDDITEYLNTLNEPIVDLSSKEFIQSVNLEQLTQPIVRIEFLENGKNKATVSKVQRGKMARYIIMNKHESIVDLKMYNEDGFIFDEELSNDKMYVFSRNK